jgi:hypothetical protein
MAVVICIIVTFRQPVSCCCPQVHDGGRRRARKRGNRGAERTTYVLECPDLAQDAFDLRVVLALELVEHGIAVLALAVGRRRPKAGALAAVDAEIAIAIVVALRVSSEPVASADVAGAVAGRAASVVACVAFKQLTSRVALMQRRRTESVGRRKGSVVSMGGTRIMMEARRDACGDLAISRRQGGTALVPLRHDGRRFLYRATDAS